MILLKGAGASTGSKVFGETNVEFVGASAGVDSATLPAHVAGDLIIGFAWSIITGETQPSRPSGWTAIEGGGTTYSPDGSTGAFLTSTGYRVATNSSTVSGTWTGSELVSFIVLRGQNGTPIGKFSKTIGGTATGSNLSTAVYREMFSGPELDVTDGSSSVLSLVSRLSTNTGIDTPPKWHDNVSGINVGSYRTAVHLSKSGLTRWEESSVSIGNNGNWITLCIEILSS